jgi:glycosyltransferase involved in cell wall biosynthesis
LQHLRLPSEADLQRPVPRERLAAVYAAHDVVLFPVRWSEPLGLVPLEAMAVGVPVVATGTGGSSEYLIHEQNCLLVEPGNAEALAAAAQRVMGDEVLRQTLVAKGRETAERNSLETSAAAVEAAAEEVVNV